jgi:hypothetical protein
MTILAEAATHLYPILGHLDAHLGQIIFSGQKPDKRSIVEESKA